MKQLGRLYTPEIQRVKSLPIAAKHVYTAFRCLTQFDNDTGTFPYSTAALVEATDLAPNTVRSAIQVLEKEGLIHFYGNEATLPLYNTCATEQTNYTYVPSPILQGLARYVRAGLGAYSDFTLQVLNQLRVRNTDPHYTYDTLRAYGLGKRRTRIRRYLRYIQDVVTVFPGRNPNVLHFRFSDSIEASAKVREEWALKREMKETVRRAVPSHLNAVAARLWDYVKERKLQAQQARRLAREFVLAVIDLGESLRHPVAFTRRFIEHLNLDFYTSNAS